MPKAVDLQPPSEISQLKLATQAKFLDNRTVTRDVLVCEVVQQLTTLANQIDQSALRVEVLPIFLEVLRKMSDAEGEHGDLPFWRTCVRGPLSVGGEEFFLLFCVEIHVRNRLDVRNANEMRRKDKTELCRIATLLLSVQHL